LPISKGTDRAKNRELDFHATEQERYWPVMFGKNQSEKAEYEEEIVKRIVIIVMEIVKS
jgi:hypothetical protein